MIFISMRLTVMYVFLSGVSKYVLPNAKTGWGMIRDTSAFVSPETYPYMLKACPNTLFLAGQGVTSEQINAGGRLPLSGVHASCSELVTHVRI